MAVSYHLNTTLGKASHHMHPHQAASLPSLSTMEKANTPQLRVYSINMFTADNHKVTFILKTQSAAEGWGGGGVGGEGTAPLLVRLASH